MRFRAVLWCVRIGGPLRWLRTAGPLGILSNQGGQHVRDEDSMFAIVSQQRSGTHFLESLINSHPDALSLGEGVLGSNGTTNNFYAYLGSLAANDPDVVRPHNLYSAWRGFLRSLAAQHPNIRRLGFILMY